MILHPANKDITRLDIARCSAISNIPLAASMSRFNSLCIAKRRARQRSPTLSQREIRAIVPAQRRYAAALP
jgi:hypothetical protein